MADYQAEKLHTACDECRSRKLKCSGGSPKCSRCERESIRCVYSPQKQMGRPRKRRRDEADTTPVDVPSESMGDSSFRDVDPVMLSHIEMLPESGLNEISGTANFNGGNGIVDSTALPQHTQNGFNHEPAANFEFGVDSSVDLPLDPNLWNAHPTGSPKVDGATFTSDQPPDAPCTCLSIMYLTLTDLQTLSSFAFPAVIPSLRQAMSTTLSIIHCEKCPEINFTAIQNVQSLTALLSAIAERFHKVLHEIDQEAERLEQAGEKKLFRIGDSNPTLQHLHTGTEYCPMGYNIPLEAREWKTFAKRALKTEVHGGGSNPVPFTALLDQAEERQNKWHAGTHLHEERMRLFGPHGVCRVGDAQCVRMISRVRGMVSMMNFDS